MPDYGKQKVHIQVMLKLTLADENILLMLHNLCQLGFTRKKCFRLVLVFSTKNLTSYT